MKKKSSRRLFLKTATAAIAAPAIVPSNVFGSAAPSNQIRLGVIGTGRMGRVNMFQALGLGLNEKNNARIAAVCDVDINRANLAKKDVQKRYADKDIKSDVRVYQDFRKMVLQKDLDGVIIATPDHQHAVNAIAAAKNGLDIYLQKPLTYSVVEGQKLIKAVRSKKVVLQVGSQQRSSYYFLKSIELVRNGYIGDIKKIDVVVKTDYGTGVATPMKVPENLDYDLWLGPAPEKAYTEHRVHPQNGFSRPGWLQVEQYCRGMITGWGAHMYDIAIWGMGNDAFAGQIDIECNGEFPDRGLFDVHVNYTGKAVYPNGVVMTSHSGRPGVKFEGTDGWILVRREGFDAHDKNIFREKIGKDGEQIYQSKNHMGDFLNCMRTRKDPAVPVEAGHKANNLCVIHHIAMKLGRKLKWNPGTEKFVNDAEANKMLDFPYRKPWQI